MVALSRWTTGAGSTYEVSAVLSSKSSTSAGIETVSQCREVAGVRVKMLHFIGPERDTSRVSATS
eukprot:3094778-Rhodomonas_salina.1